MSMSSEFITRAELSDMMEQCTTHLVNHAITVNPADRFERVYFSKCAISLDHAESVQFIRCFFSDCRFYKNGVEIGPGKLMGPPLVVTDDRTALN
jgi:hypothetical protein